MSKSAFRRRGSVRIGSSRRMRIRIASGVAPKELGLSACRRCAKTVSARPRFRLSMRSTLLISSNSGTGSKERFPRGRPRPRRRVGCDPKSRATLRASSSSIETALSAPASLVKCQTASIRRPNESWGSDAMGYPALARIGTISADGGLASIRLSVSAATASTAANRTASAA